MFASQALAQGKKVFGDLEEIVTLFGNLKPIPVMNSPKDIAAILVAMDLQTKECVSNIEISRSIMVLSPGCCDIYSQS